MCEMQSGTAGAADTHTGAATGSLSGMEVRRRSSSLQRMTIQRRPEAHHFRLWTMKGAHAVANHPRVNVLLSASRRASRKPIATVFCRDDDRRRPLPDL